MTVVLFVAALGCYFSALDAPFLFDDVDTIVDNRALRSAAPDERLWSKPQSPLSGRPVAAFSFALNYAVGGFDPRGYRLVNVLLHAVTACLLAAWIRRLTAESSALARFADRAGAWSAAVALLWVVHPLNTEAVVYVSQRTELLASFCCIAAMYAATRAWRSPSRVWPAAVTAACWLGIGSKEIVAVVPLLLPLYDRAFFADRLAAYPQRRLLYAAAASCWVPFLLIQFTAPRSDSVGFHLGIAWWQYLFAQAGVLLYYLRLVVVPYPLCGDYGQINSLAWCADYLVPGLFVIGGLLGLTAWAWRHDRRWAFVGTWFFLILAPSSSLVPIATETAAERRMYLPLIACIATAVVLADRLLTRRVVSSAARRRWFVGTIGTLAAASVALVLVRLPVYRSDEAFWADALRQVPDNPRALSNLASAYVERQQWTAAEPLLRQALASAPGSVAARHNRGVCLQATGRYAEAAQEFEFVLRSDPDHVRALTFYGLALDRLGRTDAALAALRRAVERDEAYVGARLNLGTVLARRGRLIEAREQFRRAVELDPHFTQAQANLAQVELDLVQHSDEQNVTRSMP